MTVLKIYNLEDQEEGSCLSTLPEGEHLVGRGDLLGCNDKRVSRNHALIAVGKDGVTIKSVHVNPCFYKAGNGRSIQILQKDNSLELNNNDSFGLLADKFWFKVKVIMDISEVDNSFDNDIVNGNISTNNGVAQLDENETLHNGNIESSSREATPDLEDIANTSSDLTHASVNKRSFGAVASIEANKRQKLNETDPNLSNTSPKVESPANKTKPDSEESFDLGVVQEKSSESVEKEVKLEPADDPDDVKPEIISVKKEIKEEPADESGPSTSNNTNKQQANPKRDKCWYGQNCYRKNPIHRTELSHPGDSDYDSDPNDNRPVCPFGIACYRRNLLHRQQYKHSGKPVPKPNTPQQTRPKKKQKTNSESETDDEVSDDDSVITNKKRKAAAKKIDYQESPLDDYDLEDPFIDDASSDAFELSGDSDDDDEVDEDVENSQELEEEKQVKKRLLKEAKRFTKEGTKKKVKKDEGVKDKASKFWGI